MKTWNARVREIYSNLEELKTYDKAYGIVARCKYKTAEGLWQRNPIIGGSCNPEDFGVVKKKDFTEDKEIVAKRSLEICSKLEK